MINLNEDMLKFNKKVKILENNWPTSVIDNLIPTIPLPGCISGIFPGLKVSVSYNLKKKTRHTELYHLLAFVG